MKGNDAKALKSGVWYVISSFFVKGITYLTTPIFARLLTVGEFGDYTNYASWLSIVSVLITFDLYSTVNRARFDYKEDFDKYISSITILSLIVPTVCYSVVLLNIDYFCSLLGLQSEYIHCLFCYSIAYPITNIFQARERVKYRYISSVLVSTGTTLATAFFAVLLCAVSENPLLGRVVGQTAPYVLISAIVAISMILKGKSFRWKYCKYAMRIAIPIVPHVICAQILSSSTRIAVTEQLGSEIAGIFGMAVTGSLVINILSVSINTAWAPWFGEKLISGHIDDIKKTSKYYVGAFLIVSSLLCLMIPEVVLIFGGQKYEASIQLMPPILCGAMYQFLYTLYVNVAQFEKKVIGVSIITILSAGVCAILNNVLIESFGLTGAPYALMLSYLFLLLGNFVNVCRIKRSKVFDNRFIFIMLAIATVFCFLCILLYQASIIRYVVFGLLLLILGIFVFKNKKMLNKLIKVFLKK